MKVTSVPHMEYDNLEMFNKVLDDLSEKGFKDISWGNDACPSVGISSEDGNQYLTVFVDYKDPEQREDPEWTMFHVLATNENLWGHDDYQQFVDTNDYNEMLEAVEKFFDQAINYSCQAF